MLKRTFLSSTLFIGAALACFLPCQATAADEHEIAFTTIYNDAVWGWNEEGEGFSGGGSLLQNTLPYIKFLQEFIATHNIRSVVDAGCGDWEFSKHIDWADINYIGYDVVAHVIKKNIERYSRPNVTFINGNLITTALPAADLLICKHVLQHLPNKDITSFLPQLSKFKYCLITNEVEPSTLSSENPDILVGGGHKVDLSKPPFNIACTKALNYFIGNTVHQIILVDNTVRSLN